MVTLVYCNTKGIIQLFGQYGIICEHTIIHYHCSKVGLGSRYLRLWHVHIWLYIRRDRNSFQALPWREFAHTSTENLTSLIVASSLFPHTLADYISKKQYEEVEIYEKRMAQQKRRMQAAAATNQFTA